jgi:phosphoribosylaminoimidazole-succinocarboxamide synthase
MVSLPPDFLINIIRNMIPGSVWKEVEKLEQEKEKLPESCRKLSDFIEAIEKSAEIASAQDQDLEYVMTFGQYTKLLILACVRNETFQSALQAEFDARDL